MTPMYSIIRDDKGKEYARLPSGGILPVATVIDIQDHAGHPFPLFRVRCPYRTAGGRHNHLIVEPPGDIRQCIDGGSGGRYVVHLPTTPPVGYEDSGYKDRETEYKEVSAQ